MNIKLGIFGKLIINVVNRNLNFLSLYDQNDFRISTKFLDIMKKQSKRLKTWSAMHTTFDSILFLLSCFFYYR